MSIGQRITQLRTERNMSQNQLAKAMEISRQAVSKWENGQSTPDATKMIKLAEVLDTDVEFLTTGRQVVPSRPPGVLTEVQTVEVEKIVEKPVSAVENKNCCKIPFFIVDFLLLRVYNIFCNKKRKGAFP